MTNELPMRNELIGAATRLIEVLERENAALGAMDLTAVVALVEEKHQALAALAGAQKMTETAALPSGQRQVAERLARRLDQLSGTNLRALETALHVQGQVIELIARTAARELAQRAPGYAASGRPALQRAVPLALSLPA